MSEPRVSHQCAQCGQTDDHPKVHLGTTTDEPDVQYHHDCLPFRLRAQVVEHPIAKQVVEAAESGVHGPDLLAFITDLHAREANPEPTASPVVPTVSAAPEAPAAVPAPQEGLI